MDFQALVVDISTGHECHDEPQEDSNSGVKGSNVFIAGVPSNWGQARLKELLSPFGTVLSIKLVSEKHYAFAQFKNVEEAEACIKGLHETKVSPSGKNILHVCMAVHTEGSQDCPPNPRLFLRGLPPFASKADLRRIAAPFGPLTETTLIVHPDGRCKGSAFVAFESVECASKCLQTLSGKVIPFGEDGSLQCAEVVVKYCESEEARAQRMAKNRERAAVRPSNSVTPTSNRAVLSGRTESPHPPTAALAFGVLNRADGIASGGATRAQSHPLVEGAAAAPIESVAPAHIDTLFLRGPTPAFPRPGDLFVRSPKLDGSAVRKLLANVVDNPLLICPYRDGFAARLEHQEFHVEAALMLNDTEFASGSRLVCTLVE